MTTTKQILSLRREAAEAGDCYMEAICRLALGENPVTAEPGTHLWRLGQRGMTLTEAREVCAEVINDAAICRG